MKWRQQRPPRTHLQSGAIAVADNKIYCLDETGDVGMLAVAQAGYSAIQAAGGVGTAEAKRQGLGRIRSSQTASCTCAIRN